VLTSICSSGSGSVKASDRYALARDNLRGQDADEVVQVEEYGLSCG